VRSALRYERTPQLIIERLEMINKIEELIRNYKRTNTKPIDQLNFLTSMREEIEKLIKETSKRVR